MGFLDILSEIPVLTSGRDYGMISRPPRVSRVKQPIPASTQFSAKRAHLYCETTKIARQSAPEVGFLDTYW